jgi:hypothetical protein
MGIPQSTLCSLLFRYVIYSWLCMTLFVFTFPIEWAFEHYQVIIRIRNWQAWWQTWMNKIKFTSEISDMFHKALNSSGKLGKNNNETLLNLAETSILPWWMDLCAFWHTGNHKLKLAADELEQPHIIARSWDRVEIPTAIPSYSSMRNSNIAIRRLCDVSGNQKTGINSYISSYMRQNRISNGFRHTSVIADEFS